MPPRVANMAGAMKQQLEGMIKLAAQTNMDGRNRVASFRKTIESQPRPTIKAKRIDLAKVAKIKDAPDVDVVKNMKKIVEEINGYMHNLNQMIRFDLNQQSGRFVARMIDYSEGKQIAQFPAEAMLKAHAQINAIKIADGLFAHKIPWLLIDKQA